MLIITTSSFCFGGIFDNLYNSSNSIPFLQLYPTFSFVFFFFFLLTLKAPIYLCAHDSLGKFFNLSEVFFPSHLMKNLISKLQSLMKIKELNGIEHNGRQYEKNNVHICMTWSLCMLDSRNWHNTINQLYFNFF